MSYFMQFWSILGLYDPLKGPLHYQRTTLKVSHSPESLHKIVLPEYGLISIFFEVKMTEKCQNVIKNAILDNFGTIYDPFKGPFHYQRSTLKSSFSPKSLHKFILPENLSTSNFREVEIKEICPKVVYQVILAIMGPYDPLKSPLHY